MVENTSVARLFELAIAAEGAAEKLYRGLVEKFSHYNDVAEFWALYAIEEAGHALWLERLRDRLDAEKLAATADPSMLEYAYRALNLSVDTALARVHNLEDAYQLVSDLENSETNAVFDFLVINFSYDQEVLSFLQRQLEGHVSRLMTEFSNRFQDRQARFSIRAQNSD